MRATSPASSCSSAAPACWSEHPALATHRRAMVRHLEVLHDDEVARLLDGLVVGLPGDARESLVARAEGVPLFAVETVRSLIDRDLVVPRGGQYVLASPETLDLDSVGAPASLHALVAARLDALDWAQRRLVDRACVVGTVFSRDQIAALCAELDGVDDVLSLCSQGSRDCRSSASWRAGSARSTGSTSSSSRWSARWPTRPCRVESAVRRTSRWRGSWSGRATDRVSRPHHRPALPGRDRRDAE